MNTPAEIIRQCYTAYEKKDRAALEKILTDDFTFSSPLDDNISRATYFDRCWPNSQHLDKFEIKELFVEGNKAFVRYEATPKRGAKFQNTEFFTLKGDQIQHVDVYFGSEEPEKANENEIRALINETVQACCDKNVAALMSHYSPEVLAFDLIEPLRYSGLAALSKRVTQWFDSFQGNLDYALKDLSIAAGGDTAFAHSMNHVRGTTTGGKKIDMWWRATLGLQKLDGKWLITHAHSSEPFDMETGKASVELKP